MAKATFYPLGNADCCLIQTDAGKRFVFDFADVYNANDASDKRMPLAANLKEDIGWPSRKEVEVLAITHGDNDHVQGIPDTFWLDHAKCYQSDDRIKAKELWVPAALIVEKGAEDDTRIVRAEAIHRFLNKKGIRVFSRPEHLKDWLEARGKNLDDYRSLITDAGQMVPALRLDLDGIEFFAHSPFAQRTEDGFLDRNDHCLVLQATIRGGGRDTRFLITADSVAESWTQIVNITRARNNAHRLAWDIFSIPHHCSYKSMAEKKGDEKTTPTPEFEWLLEQGTRRSVMVSTSWPIPETTEKQPPHLETFRRYKDTADALDAELAVTMEHPSERNPKRLIVEMGSGGATLKKEYASASIAVTTTHSPRVG